MKRITAIFLTLLLTLQLSACIEVVDGGYRPNGSTTERAEDSFDRIPRPPTPVVYPTWSGLAEMSEAFLSMTGAIVDVSKRTYSYAEMVEDLSHLARLHSDYFSYHSFGTSVAGRELYVAVLGNPEASRQILVSAGIHGREYLTPLLAMKQIEFYLAYRETGVCQGYSYAQMLQNYCFYIVPMTNPDGVMLSQEGIASISDRSLYDKIYSVYYKDYEKGYTQQTDIDEYLKIWKANANAVDLNRNFDALWDRIDTGMYRPSHKNYKGPSAASEPETRALAQLTESLSNVRAVLCLHSQGEVLYWDCGQSGALRTETLAFAKMIGKRTGYELKYDQNNDASFSDWCALERGLIAVTVETGMGACPLEISQFTKIWNDNFDLLPRSAAYFEGAT